MAEFKWGDLKLSIRDNDVATLQWYCERAYEWQMCHCDLDTFIDFIIDVLDMDDSKDRDPTESFEFCSGTDNYEMHYRDALILWENQELIAEKLSF